MYTEEMSRDEIRDWLADAQRQLDDPGITSIRREQLEWDVEDLRSALGEQTG